MGTREVSRVTQEGFDEGVWPKLDRGEREGRQCDCKT